MSVRLIDPVTGEVLFDSDNVNPALLDSERDHIVGERYADGSGGWSISTPEQVERQLASERPSRFDCETCEGDGILKVLGKFEVCPTCLGIVRPNP